MITITSAVSQDTPVLADIMKQAWRAGFRGILTDAIIEQYTQTDACTAIFAQILASGEGTMYLARMDSKPVGLLYWLPEQEDIRIEALLTIPEAWSKGVAAALMEQTLADAATFRTVHVWPFTENFRARRFYEKHGFISSGNSRMGDAPEIEYIRNLQ